jgi:hypothetical protein
LASRQWLDVSEQLQIDYLVLELSSVGENSRNENTILLAIRAIEEHNCLIHARPPPVRTPAESRRTAKFAE